MIFHLCGRTLPVRLFGSYAQYRRIGTVLRTLALLLAALYRVTPKQAKEPNFHPTNYKKRLGFNSMFLYTYKLRWGLQPKLTKMCLTQKLL